MSRPPATRRLTVQAPTRVDFAGGTLDLWPLYLFFPGSRTLNAAIDLLSTARLEAMDSGYEIISRDQGRSVRAAALADLDPQNTLPLPVRLVRHFAPAPGVRVITENRSPVGAGLGGSSSLAVALAAALSEWTQSALPPAGLIALVGNLEAQVLRVPTGIQDYFAAVHGGVSLLSLGPEGVKREPLPDVSDWLGSRLVLCYTGAPHQSGVHNWDIYRRVVDRDPGTCRALETIAAAAADMESALRNRDAEAFASVLDREWAARQLLAPGVTTPRLDDLIAHARGAGALAAKVCGAGGGGCVLLVAREGGAERLAAALQGHGAELLPLRFSPGGLSQRWD
jgi:D-glycero-alpha-D-manno-heptose-7-phosphate kinase